MEPQISLIKGLECGQNQDNSFRLWPVYHMKKSFVGYNKMGSSIFDTVYDPDSIDVLAVENDDGTFITLVNKKNRDDLVNITIINGTFKELIDLDNNERYSILNNKVGLSLKPYDIKFLQVK